MQGGVVWFTGLSGAGKSSLARAVADALRAQGVRCAVLDGDELRRSLSADLGFSLADRSEHLRRAGEAARALCADDVLVLAAFISPMRRDRARLREAIAPYAFREVYCDCPLAVCERRDAKGLYARARAGVLADFTGISSPYQAPLAPDCRIDSAALSLEQSVARVLAMLAGAGVGGQSPAVTS